MKTYKGIEYIVFWFDRIGYYNGYVRIPDNHPDNKKIDRMEEVFGRKLIVGYDDIDIDCHGGLTFGERITKENKDNFPQGFSEGAWIGWNYAHVGDKIKFYEEDGKEWTEKEVEEECKNVIEQLLKTNL